MKMPGLKRKPGNVGQRATEILLHDSLADRRTFAYTSLQPVTVSAWWLAEIAAKLQQGSRQAQAHAAVNARRAVIVHQMCRILLCALGLSLPLRLAWPARRSTVGSMTMWMTRMSIFIY
jgi:hypothetical protein